MYKGNGSSMAFVFAPAGGRGEPQRLRQAGQTGGVGLRKKAANNEAASVTHNRPGR